MDKIGFISFSKFIFWQQNGGYIKFRVVVVGIREWSVVLWCILHYILEYILHYILVVTSKLALDQPPPLR